MNIYAQDGGQGGNKSGLEKRTQDLGMTMWELRHGNVAEI